MGDSKAVQEALTSEEARRGDHKQQKEAVWDVSRMKEKEFRKRFTADIYKPIKALVRAVFPFPTGFSVSFLQALRGHLEQIYRFLSNDCVGSHNTNNIQCCFLSVSSCRSKHIKLMRPRKSLQRKKGWRILRFRFQASSIVKSMVY